MPGMPERRRALLGVLSVLVAATLFGTLGPVARSAYGAGMEPLAFATWRVGIAAVVLLAFLAGRILTGERLVSIRRLPLRERLGLVGGAVGLFAVNGAIFVAFDRIAVALALLCFYLYPALVALTASALGWERLDRVRVGALVLAFGGVVLVLTGQLDPGSALRLDVVGVLFALGAACFQVLYILSGRRGYRHVPTEQAVTLFTLVSALGYLLLAPVLGMIEPLSLPLRQPSLWPTVLFAGICGAAVPSFLFLTAIRTIGSTRTAILAMIEPVVGASLAAVLLGETLGPVQALGGGFVVAAGILLQRSTGAADEMPKRPTLTVRTPG